MILEAVTLGGLTVKWNTAVTYALLAAAALVTSMQVFARMKSVDVAVGEILKEVAVFALVAYFIVNIHHYIKPAVASVDDALQKAQSIADACYCRLVKAAQCVANIRLSGPASAYAGFAEAKLSKYTAVYQQALWQYSQLAGLIQWFKEYGGILLAAGLLIYAAWLRSLGGVIIGLMLGIWLGATYLLNSVQVDVSLCYGCQGKTCQGAVGSKDFHPVLDVGCDDKLAEAYERDYDAWRYATAAYWLFLAVVPALAAAAGFLLSRV